MLSDTVIIGEMNASPAGVLTFVFDFEGLGASNSHLIGH